MENFEKLVELVHELRGDYEKFYERDNNAAGTRLRKSLKEVADLCKVERARVTDTRNARKTV